MGISLTKERDNSMPSLFKIPEKPKAILILVAGLLVHLSRVANHLVKIFDDSELTVQEAVEFTTTEGGILVGEWQSRKSKEP